jgi:hypothetical protein
MCPSSGGVGGISDGRRAVSENLMLKVKIIRLSDIAGSSTVPLQV